MFLVSLFVVVSPYHAMNTQVSSAFRIYLLLIWRAEDIEQAQENKQGETWSHTRQQLQINRMLYHQAFKNTYTGEPKITLVNVKNDLPAAHQRQSPRSRLPKFLRPNRCPE